MHQSPPRPGLTSVAGQHLEARQDREIYLLAKGLSAETTVLIEAIKQRARDLVLVNQVYETDAKVIALDQFRIKANVEHQEQSGWQKEA